MVNPNQYWATPQGQKEIAHNRALTFKQKEMLRIAKREGSIGIEEIKWLYRNQKGVDCLQEVRRLELRGLLAYESGLWRYTKEEC